MNKKEKQTAAGKFFEEAINASNKYIPASLAKALKKDPQTITHWKNRGVPKGFLFKVAELLDTSERGLATGKLATGHGGGTTTRSDPVPPSGGPTISNISTGPDVKGFLPLISWVAAGSWSDVSDPYEAGDANGFYPCPVAHGNHSFILKVRGVSMEPEYPDGEWIFVDPDRQAENGSHIIVRLDDSEEATFKKLVIEGGTKYLEALNPNWPEKIIRINSNATIVGVVIFSGKPR